MNQIMTLAEVNDKFDSEWVLLSDTEVGDRHQILSGRVLWHSKDRDEVYRKLLELRPRKAAAVYAGTIPSDRIFAL